MPDKQPEMVEGLNEKGEVVQVAKTTPEETIPRVRTQKGTIFSRAEQDRLANQNLLNQEDQPSDTVARPLPEAGGASIGSTQAPAPASIPSAAPARGGTARSTPTRPRGQE
jgi:hypothetical protein